MLLWHFLLQIVVFASYAYFYIRIPSEEMLQMNEKNDDKHNIIDIVQ